MTAIDFLPEKPFIEQNHEAIQAVFNALAQDYPERTVVVDDQEISAQEALQIGDDHELSEAARTFLWRHAQGAQHGYDRGVQGKIDIDDRDAARYMDLLFDIDYGAYNFVDGGASNVGSEGRNIIVPSSFPHATAGRLATTIEGDYERLWEVESVALNSGQRPRWKDNAHEDTSATVLSRTAQYTGLDLRELRDRRLFETWQSKSTLAREQAALPEHRRFLMEVDMARLALEFAMIRTEELFEWGDYPLAEHLDEQAEPLRWSGGIMPAREVAAYEYKTTTGRSFWVTNGAAQPRIAPDGSASEPRPNSDSSAQEAFEFLGPSWQAHESIIGAGAPHIRLAIDTAIRLVQMSEGSVQPLHAAVSPWKSEGEVVLTGIANIVSTYKADKRARALVAGEDPDSSALASL